MYVKPLGLLVGLYVKPLGLLDCVSDLLICLLDYVCQASWFACWIVYVKPLGLLDCVRPLGFLVALCMSSSLRPQSTFNHIYAKSMM